MADNVGYTPGSGSTVAADDIGGVLHQRIKLVIGADGVSDGDVSSSNPIPTTSASLPLPSGAATSARQDTGNTSLSSIDGKTPALGQALAAASSPVVLTAAQLATLTPFSTVAISNGFLLDATFTGRINTQGQKAMAASTPVVIASDQTVIPVSQSGTWTTGRTWTLASGTDSIAAVQSGTWNLANITGTVTLPTNAAQETGGNLATLVAKDFATSAKQDTQITALVAIEAGIGAIDDESVRLDEDGSVTARLRSLGEQIDELIGVQRETQELLFRMLVALTSDGPKQLEVN